MNGALLIHKPAGISSFGVIEELQRQLISKTGLKRRDLPKLGHGGTLDPFATGLLVVLVGQGAKLARYFLGSNKVYEGRIHFGIATPSGDPATPVSETSAHLPKSLLNLQEQASQMTEQPYLQIPPMHSAKKKEGKRLYQLARAGIEIDRDPQLCHLYQFEILDYQSPYSNFRVHCSSGTYIRTLVQDFSRQLETVGLLETLHRTHSGNFSIDHAWTLDRIGESIQAGKQWDELDCWIPFNQLMLNSARVQATPHESLLLTQGQQSVLEQILSRTNPSHTNEERVAIYCSDILIGIARHQEMKWEIERVFIQPQLINSSHMEALSSSVNPSP